MDIPTIRFFRSRSVPKEDSQKFREYWTSVGNDLLKSVEKYTGLRWKRDRISIHMKPESGADILGWIEPSKPYDIMLHLTPDNRVNMSTIAHEIVHTNIWSNYMDDLRWKEITLFEDVFADELLTEIIAQKVCIRIGIGGRRRIHYSWAIQYGFITTFLRVGRIIGLELPENLRSLERRWGVDRRTQPRGLKSFRGVTRDKLVSWSRDYFREVREGKTNAMEARRKLVENIPSLSDYLGRELFFR